MSDQDRECSATIRRGDVRFTEDFRRHAAVMLLLDPGTGLIVDANVAAANFYGYAVEVLRGMPIHDVNTPPSPELRREMQRALLGERNDLVFRHRLADGSLRTVEFRSSPIDSPRGPLLLSIVFDITTRKQAEESLRQAMLVYQNSNEAMLITDMMGTVITINPAFTDITGYSEAEIVGQNMRILAASIEDPEVHRTMLESIVGTGRWQGEIWGRRKNGQRFLRWLSTSTVHDEAGVSISRVTLFSDITQKRESSALIWRQANFDSLTGLPNRSMFQDRLSQAIRRALRNQQRLALLFLDLDFFKEINDTLGHSMGDRLLQIAAQRLTHCVRGSDTVARLGGDEFTIILSDLQDNNQVERVVYNILQALAEPFQLGAERVFVSASLGVTLCPDDGTDAGVLLKHADQAMYSAKALGRNRCSYFTPSMQEAAQARKRLVSDLRMAFEQDQFRVVYQPIIDLRSGQICKAEALVRWQHPDRGLVNPADFISVTEQTGIILSLGDWVFRQAANQVVLWLERFGPDFQINVNVSPAQFQNDGINHDAWFYYLEQRNLTGRNIGVEITEGLLMDTNPSVTDLLFKFRDSGMQVALDDFGTGYSSLAYLKKFDIDYIKIDRVFVQNLAPGSDDLVLCEAMTVMAHKLGIKVVAEGVETVQQRDLLVSIGCDYAQGYLFSEPVSAEEFENLRIESAVIASASSGSGVAPLSL